jgi:hypothetical protein
MAISVLHPKIEITDTTTLLRDGSNLSRDLQSFTTTGVVRITQIKNTEITHSQRHDHANPCHWKEKKARKLFTPTEENISLYYYTNKKVT